jgi:2',3'-cyclic-nucleotide 2'-phosphodiesterase (5'-nucleotidase family)
LNLSENKAALDLIKTELTRLQSQNESLTVNTKNLTAERDMCSHSECSLGNLITDAMVAALRSNSTWTSNASRIGIFPAVHLEPNGTIPEGMFTKTEAFYIIDLLEIQLLNL